MATEVQVPTKSDSNGVLESPEMKSFATRICDLPVVMAAVEQLGMLYSNVKEKNSLTKMACEAGESTLQMATSATKPLIQAASTTALSIKQVDYAASTIDHVASETLAKVEEKLPLITKTPTEIKETVANTATEYYKKVQNSSVAQMVITQAEHLVSFSEIVTEIVLPTDGNCKEDMEDLEAHEEIKGAVNRTKRVTRRMVRRGKKKLMKYKSVKLSVDAATCAHERLAGLMSTSKEAGKKVFDAYMYIPSKAMQVSGAVIVGAKDFVFAFTEAHSVKDMPAALLNVTLKATEPLADMKDKAMAFVYIPNQAMMDYALSSRLVQWIVPQIVAAEDMDIILDEIEDSTESEDHENNCCA